MAIVVMLCTAASYAHAETPRYFRAGDDFPEFVRYEYDAFLDRITISAERIASVPVVAPSAKESVPLWDKKNLFYVEQTERKITRTQHIAGKEVKTLISIIPPGNKGAWAAIVSVFVSDVQKTEVWLAAGDTPYNTLAHSIVITPQEIAVMNKTADGITFTANADINDKTIIDQNKLGTAERAAIDTLDCAFLKASYAH